MNVLNLNLIYVDPNDSIHLPVDFVSLVNAFSEVAGLKLIDFRSLDRDFDLVPKSSSLEEKFSIKVNS